MSPLQILFFGLACLLIGLSKGGLGGPLPVTLVTPLLAMVLDEKSAITLVIPFLIFADWFALRLYWRKWDSRQIWLMMPMALVGAFMGAFFLAIISKEMLRIIIGVMALVVVAYKLMADRFENLNYSHRNWHAYLAAWSSSLASTIANAGAPPFTIYLLLQKLDAVTFIGTTTLFFTVVNFLKVPIFWQQGLINFEQWMSVAWALPIIPLGVWLGRKAIGIIDQKSFERLIMLLLIACVAMLFVSL